jgi:hypothetical protein
MTLLAPSMQAYFTDRLIDQRRARPNTIAAYRHTFQLLLRFATKQTGTPPGAAPVHRRRRDESRRRGTAGRTRRRSSGLPDDDRRFDDPEVLVLQTMDVLRNRAFCIPVGRPSGVTGSAVIRGDDAEPRHGQLANQVTPFPPGLGKAVQQHDRAGTVAVGHVVDPHTWLDVGEAVREMPSN